MIYHFNGAPLFYEVTGKGPAIVLLHGFLERSSMWQDVVNSLSEKYTFICMDLPGHGKSGVLGEIHSMELMADAVYSLMQHLEVESAHVVGHSMGGYVALALAEEHPDFIDHLILLNSTCFADSPERKKQRDRAIRFINEEKDTIIRMAITNLFYPEDRPQYQSEIEALKNDALAFPTTGIIAAIRGMKDRKDRTHVLKSFPGSKTIVCGNRDPIVPMATSKLMATLTNTPIQILDGSHMSWIENRDEIVKIVHFIE